MTFLVPTVPDLGQTPESQASGLAAAATGLAILYNHTLTSALDRIEEERGVEIIRFNSFRFLRSIVRRPQRFGLSNVTEACLQLPVFPFLGNPVDGGTPCANPDEHLFWDFIHPTAVAHAIFGRALRDVISCDANDDGIVTVRDAIAVLRSIRTGRPLRGRGDCNDDGRVDLADTICILQYVVQNGAFPPAPGPGLMENSDGSVSPTPAGEDPTPDKLDCDDGADCL